MKIAVLGTGFGMVHLQTFAKHPLGLDVLPLEACVCDFDWLCWCLGKLTLVSTVATEVSKTAACIDKQTTMTARSTTV